MPAVNAGQSTRINIKEKFCESECSDPELFGMNFAGIWRRGKTSNKQLVLLDPVCFSRSVAAARPIIDETKLSSWKLLDDFRHNLCSQFHAVRQLPKPNTR